MAQLTVRNVAKQVVSALSRGEPRPMAAPRRLNTGKFSGTRFSRKMEILPLGRGTFGRGFDPRSTAPRSFGPTATGMVRHDWLHGRCLHRCEMARQGSTFSEGASSLLEGETTLVAPELLFAEVSNALWAMRQRGDIDGKDLADATDALRASPITIPLSMRQLAAAATRLAVDLDHPVYDCFYLAPAIQEQHPVVTADARFHDKVHGHPCLSDWIRPIAPIA